MFCLLVEQHQQGVVFLSPLVREYYLVVEPLCLTYDQFEDKKKLIVCEHCGRILAGVDIEPIVEKPKAKRTARKKTTTTAKTTTKAVAK